MRYNALLDTLQNLINYSPSQKELGEKLGLAQTSISGRANRNSNFTDEEIEKLEKAYNISIISKEPSSDEEIRERIKKLQQKVGIVDNSYNVFNVTYRPDVFLSAGYGVEVYTEEAQTMALDSRLFVSDKGNKIDPKFCEVVSISGNSMAPEYRHGDKVIIDKNDTELLDGHIFAFRYNGKCYVKEINLLGKRIKCISLNKEYDPFYIEDGEDFTVFGRILPRIRL